MKVLILSLISFVILSFSGIAAAEKIVITGSPIVVEKQNDVYVPATEITSSRDYYYFTIGGVQRICYREVPSTLENVSIGSGTYRVRIGTEAVNLYCYDYNTDYFVVQ